MLFRKAAGEPLGVGTYGIVSTASGPDGREVAVKRNLGPERLTGICNPSELDILNQLRNVDGFVQLEQVFAHNPYGEGPMSPLKSLNHIGHRDDRIHYAFTKSHGNLLNVILGGEQGERYLKFVYAYMVDLVNALQNLHHRKIIHRDLTSRNILLYESGVKICDFGLSEPFTFQSGQQEGVITAWYRPSEICLGSLLASDPITHERPRIEYDLKADVHSLGCIFIEMIIRQIWSEKCKDDDVEILQFLINHLPKPLPLQVERTMLSGTSLREDYQQAKKRGFVNFRTQFTSSEWPRSVAGLMEDLDLFCDLIEHMTDFNPDTRYDMNQVANHEFFKPNRQQMATYRAKNAYLPIPRVIKIAYCNERVFARTVVVKLLQNRPNWYRHRIVMQAISFFDRYLVQSHQGLALGLPTRSFSNPDLQEIRAIPLNKSLPSLPTGLPSALSSLPPLAPLTPLTALPILRALPPMAACGSPAIPVRGTGPLQLSETSGLIFNQDESIFHFWCCLYMSYKYFRSIETPQSFAEFAVDYSIGHEGDKRFVEFEERFIFHCANQSIYRPTAYEVADETGRLLTDRNAVQLIMMYFDDQRCGGISPRAMFELFSATH